MENESSGRTPPTTEFSVWNCLEGRTTQHEEEAGEKVQPAKYLPQKHEGLTSIFSTHIEKSGYSGHTTSIVLGKQRQEDL